MSWCPVIFDMVPIDHEFFNTNPNDYMVTKHGDIYSNKQHRFLNPKPSKSTGYYYLRTPNGAIVYHRIVGRAYVDGYSDIRNCINHINGDKTRNFYQNLEWVSKAENNRHAYETGLNNYIGGRCKDAKISNQQAHQICKYLEEGYSYNEIIYLMNMDHTPNNYEIIRYGRFS